jgi:hypothetical protein
MSHSVYISYSPADGFMMQRIRHDISHYEFTVWTSDQPEALPQADCVLVLLSPDSIQEEVVRYEIYTARSMRKPLFPVLVAGEEEEVASVGFRPHQWTDLRYMGDYEPNMNRLLNHIARELDIPVESWPTLHTVPVFQEDFEAELLASQQAAADARAGIPAAISKSLDAEALREQAELARLNQSLPIWWFVALALFIIIVVIIVLLFSN